MSSRAFKEGQESYRSAKSMRRNHEEMQVMHSDKTLFLLMDAINIEPQLKIFIIELMGGKDEGNKNWYEDGMKYWKEREPIIIKKLNEMDRKRIETGDIKPHTTTDGFIHLLRFVQQAIGFTSAEDFNKFARESFDPVLKEGNYTPSERKKKSIVADELDGFDEQVQKEFSGPAERFDQFDFSVTKAPDVVEEDIESSVNDIYNTTEDEDELEEDDLLEDDFNLEEYDKIASIKRQQNEQMQAKLRGGS